MYCNIKNSPQLTINLASPADIAYSYLPGNVTNTPSKKRGEIETDNFSLQNILLKLFTSCFATGWHLPGEE